MRNFLLLTFALTLGLIVTGQQKLSIEDAVLQQYGTLYPDRVNALQWMEGVDKYSFVEDNTLMIGDVKGKSASAMTLDQLKELSGLDLSRFPSVNWIDKNTFYFQSGNSFYTAALKGRGVSKSLELAEGAANVDYLRSANRAAYTIDNNVWVNINNTAVQITDNVEGVVSGQAIARYEFGISTGTFWSPDGNYLAFYEKDERGVTDYPMVDYSTMPASLMPIKYPMAGQQGELAAVGVFNTTTNTTVYLNLNRGVRDDSFYATNVGWNPSGKSLYVAVVNRDQNHMWLQEFDAETGNMIQTLFEEENEKYVEPEHAPQFVPSHDDQFIWISERDGYDNIYLYSADGTLIGHTDFQFPVTAVLGFDTKGTTLFVEATGADAVDNHIFKIDLKSMTSQRLTRVAGVHSGKLSSSGTYLIDTWSNLETPRVTEILLENGKIARKIKVSENPMTNYSYGTTEIFTQPAQDGTPLWCRMIKPSNFDASKKYPVIVYVYGGPHAQMVSNSWNGGAPLWMHSIAEEGFIIFTIDSRGSANRGRDFEQAIHRNLGTIELEDQEFVTNWLKSQPYTDENRFGVHGWSYGGFMTTSLMLKKPGLFEVGVAGGPVIDWNLYEIMYTERYMDTPQQNPEGFENADLTRHVKNLKGELLLIHGNIDDVVVLQHNMKFQRQCVKDDVQVDFAIYPSHPHNVRGADRVHLIKKIFRYFVEYL